MIKPSDIQTKEFKKVALGYSQEEVDEFLDEIIVDYGRLYKETIELKDKINILNENAEYYRSMEKTMQNTILLGQKAAEEAKQAAQLHGRQIIKEAEIQAAQLLQDSEKKRFDLEQEISKLESRYELMRTRIKLLLYAEIELIDKNEIFAQKEEQVKKGKQEFMKNIKALQEERNG